MERQDMPCSPQSAVTYKADCSHVLLLLLLIAEYQSIIGILESRSFCCDCGCHMSVVRTLPCMLPLDSHQQVELPLPPPEWFQKGSLPLARTWPSGSDPVHLRHRLGHHCQTCHDRGQDSGHASPPHSAKEATLHYTMSCCCMYGARLT